MTGHLDQLALPGLAGPAAALVQADVLAGHRGPDAVYRLARDLARRDGITSEDRLLTIGRRALLAAGYHPMTRLPLLAAQQGATCGTCTHMSGERGTYRKCAKHRRSASRATDVVATWPACTLWETRP